MKLLIVGATGGIGLEVVRQAVEREHSVTVLARDPSRIDVVASGVHAIKGDLLDVETLARAASGSDAVISAFGPRVPLAKADRTLCQRFAETLTVALPRAGVRRAVIVTAAFLFRDAIMPPAYLAGRLFFRSLADDLTAMESLIRSSALDWTIVRPPQLTDRAATHRYRVLEGHLPPFGFKITRTDVADYLLASVQNDATIRKIIGVSA